MYQKPTATIDVNGLLLPVHFGALTMEHVERLSFKKYTDVLQGVESGNATDILHLCFAGLKIGALRDKVPMSVDTVEDLAFAADENPELLAKIIEVFMQQNIAPIIEQQQKTKSGNGQAPPKRAAASRVTTT